MVEIARRPSAWWLIALAAVFLGVGFSTLMIVVAYGARAQVHAQLAEPAFHLSLTQVHSSVIRVNSILDMLAIVVTSAMLVQTAAATSMAGIVLMQARRREIATRRGRGVEARVLVREFALEIVQPALLGGLLGEGAAVGVALALSHLTVLPVQFTAFSLGAAFPVTVLLAVGAALVPAWRLSGRSPHHLLAETG